MIFEKLPSAKEIELTSPAVDVVSQRNVRRLERIDERESRLDGSSQPMAVGSLD